MSQVFKREFEELENKITEIKQVSNVNVAKGQSITDTDIIDAKEVVLFYTVKDDFYSSVVARNDCGTWILALRRK